MITPKLGQLLQPMRTTMALIWSALTASIAVYVGIAYVIVAHSDGAPGQAPAEFAAALYGVAAAVAIASLVYRQRALSDARLRTHLSRQVDLEVLARHPQTGRVDPERLEQLRELDPIEQKLFAVARATNAPFIVTLAFHEAIALFGFVLAIFERSPASMLPLAVAAVALNILTYPRLEPILMRARAFAY